MTWLQRYHLRHYLANSLWPLPVLSMVVAIVAVRLLHGVEVSLGWESDIKPETAQAFLGTMASSRGKHDCHHGRFLVTYPFDFFEPRGEKERSDASYA